MAGLIDFHVHSFPPEFENASKRREFADEHQEPFWSALMNPDVDTFSLQGWVSVEDMLRKMDEGGVDRVVLQGWYWQQFETCQLHNRWMAELMHQHPDRISAFASILPTGDGRALEELRWALDAGFSGVGELHPSVQEFSLLSDSWKELAAFAQEYHLPVLFHVTEPVGRLYEPRKDTDFRELQRFIESFADLDIILAHWGGLVFAHHLNPYVQTRWKNVYYDTAATPLLYRSDIVDVALKVLPADRILYGSDFPLKVYPSDPKQPEFSRFIEDLKKHMPGDHYWEPIRAGNAARLLGSESNDGSFAG